MDLFVINRYKEPDEEVTVDRETQNLQKLKQKIEERKKSIKVQNKPTEIILKPTNISENIDNSQDSEKTVPIQVEPIKSETKREPRKQKTEKSAPEFKVLGTNEFQKKVLVKRILPHWLSHSSKISTNLQNLNCQVQDIDWLHSTLKSTLISEGITKLFPVQEEVIPFILKEHRLPPPFWPHDVCVSAPTGSGKTLSFVLPIIQILMNETGHHIRALVVLPVQELATQVVKVFKKFAAKTSLKVALLSGSTPLHQEQKLITRHTESSGWCCEADIIVCTAGRLVEHLQNTEGFSLKHLKFLVIDEADRIMDHIQNDWLYHLDKYIKLENELMTGATHSSSWNRMNSQVAPPHKLLFSATLSHDPEKLEQWSLFQPKLFSSTRNSIFEDDEKGKKYVTPMELNEQFITCEAEVKPLILYHLLVEKKLTRVLCFTNAAQSAHRLSVLLNVWAEGQIKVAELSASLDRNTREQVLKKFHQSEIDVLIGTDALARGIDITECNYVISYDPPRNIKTYIHRIGRTGRAGKTGNAITILLQNQENMFKETLQWERSKSLPQYEISKDLYDRLSQKYETAIKSTKFAIHEEINNKVKKSIELKRGNKQNKKKNSKFGKKPKLSDNKTETTSRPQITC